MSAFKTILFFVIFSGLGFVLIPRIPIDLLPRPSAPVLTISFSMPDAPPQVIEQEATSPLENSLSQLSDLKRIYSISKNGYGSVELRFDNHADIAVKKFEASSIIRHLYRSLDRTVTYPIITQQSHSDKSRQPLLIYRINARLAPFQIKNIADDALVPILAQQAGVSEVNIQGSEDLQISIVYDRAKLTQFGIRPSDITDQISTEFRTFFPGVLLTSTAQRFMIKGGRSLQDIRELEGVIIRGANGQSYPLKSLASIYLEETQPSQYYRVNGMTSVVLAIHAHEGTNRLELGDRLKHKMISLNETLPKGFSIMLDYDDTAYLQKELNKNFLRAILSFGILLVFLFVSYRSLRHVAILFSGILITLGILSLMVFLAGIRIHLYTIAGVTIAVGIIIDNSIVVLDHISTRKDRKVFRAVLGAALATAAALMLVLFLPEDDRRNLIDFSLVVSLAVGCSVLTAWFYTPAVHAMFKSTDIKDRKSSRRSLRLAVSYFSAYSKTILYLSRYRKTFITSCILAFGIPVFMLPARWDGNDFYNRTIGSDLYQEKIRPATDMLLGGALRFFVRNVYERSGYREAQQTKLFVTADLSEGHTIEVMNQIIMGMEGYLNTVQGVEKYITHVYSGQHATIAIDFTDDHQNSSLPYRLKNQLIAKSLDWGGVDWNIYGVGQGFSNASAESIPSFRVVMTGYNYHTLEHYSNVLASKLLKHKRVQKVNTNERLSWDEKSIEHLVFNFASAPPSAGSVRQLASGLQEHGSADRTAFHLPLKDELLPVHLKPSISPTLSKYDVLNTPLLGSDSQFVKLSSMATIHNVKTSNAVHKENRNYIRIVGFEYYGNYTFGNEFLSNLLVEMEKELPPGYKATKSSYRWDWEKAKRQYGLILILAVGVYLIASVLFENLRQPFFIVLVIPLSFVGIFLTFSIFDLYFDQGGYAAFILLGGLVVNASIYIVNDVNNSKRKNSRYLLKAVAGKMKPILLTIASTCLGLIPFMIGGQNEVFWFALAAGTTGGLIFSVFVVLIFLPVVLIPSDRKSLTLLQDHVENFSTE